MKRGPGFIKNEIIGFDQITKGPGQRCSLFHRSPITAVKCAKHDYSPCPQSRTHHLLPVLLNDYTDCNNWRQMVSKRDLNLGAGYSIS